MKEVLVYIRPQKSNADGTFDYEFFFSDTPADVWGPDWDSSKPSICGDITPDSSTYNKVCTVNSSYKLKTVEETDCYTMRHATYGITALAWIDIEQLEEYPENGRMVFHFGDTKEKVVELLSLYDFNLNESPSKPCSSKPC